MPATIDSPTTRSSLPVELRAMERADIADVAGLVYEAFATIHDHYRFQRDFPSLAVAEQMTSAFVAHPSIWGVVAECDGQIVGSNFLDERGAIRGLGPITVHPAAQSRGVGRRLMEAALERARGAAGVRLLQDSFNVASLSLYASLGFEVKEPAVVLSGRPRSGPPAAAEVRPLEEGDIVGCEELCLSVHGFERTHEVRDALATDVLSPFVAVRDGRVSAYATTLSPFVAAHAVAETDDDMRALILGAMAATEARASFLLPTRQARLFGWCLDEGLRVVKPMTYMAIGEYREPAGCWIPSVLY